jgi:thiamine-monophosphate kinase
MEQEFIRWLRSKIAPDRRAPLGLGDDAALLRLDTHCDLVVTSDLLTDQVDFVLDECEPRRVGRKALAVNLSDLAAMAARPLAVIISVALPDENAASLARALYEGLLPLADQFQVAVAGGDTNTWPGPLAISVTALGQAAPPGPLRRDGARPGDAILTTGEFGGSILGKHFDFEPRVREALMLRERYELHAGIDVSDGLTLDLARIAAESQCGAAIALDAVPISPAAGRLSNSSEPRKSPLEHALGDGEDFELVLAAPPQAAEQLLQDQPLDVPVTRIGHFVPEPGLWELRGDRAPRPLQPQGWDHGR